MYRLPAEDVTKLPSDQDGHYFGDDEGGYSLHEGDWDKYRIEWNGTDWKPLL